MSKNYIYIEDYIEDLLKTDQSRPEGYTRKKWKKLSYAEKFKILKQYLIEGNTLEKDWTGKNW